ncbi:MAG TPA: TetR/AcrR family transcriptional regulator [Sporichthyaceae bacterium]|nr:TetR/AcrR family transcriptional regulator [Sporichthyaceae bacterium]
MSTDTDVEAGGARRRMPRAQREALMLDVAETLFGELGYRAVSMDEIAARVGVSKPMLYHYYGSKDGLFVACLRRARAGMRDAILAGAMSSEVREERLYGALVSWFRFVDEHSTLWKIITDSELEFREAAEEIEAIRDEQTGLIAGLMAATATPAHLADPVELQVVAAAISGVGERVAHWRAGHPEVTPERAARHLMQLLWLGLERMGEGAQWERSGA